MQDELNVLQGHRIIASTLCSILILLCHSSQPACSVWESYIISTRLLWASLHMLCSDPANKTKHWFIHVMQSVHNGQCRLYWLIWIKRRYAVLNGRRERDIVRLPAPVQIAPELPTVTALYSLKLILRRNLVGDSCGNADLDCCDARLSSVRCVALSSSVQF